MTGHLYSSAAHCLVFRLFTYAYTKNIFAQKEPFRLFYTSTNSGHNSLVREMFHVKQKWDNTIEQKISHRTCGKAERAMFKTIRRSLGAALETGWNLSGETSRRKVKAEGTQPGESAIHSCHLDAGRHSSRRCRSFEDNRVQHEDPVILGDGEQPR